MKQELKDKWVKALRSGEYIQGNGDWETGTSSDAKQCCLSVLLIEAGLTEKGKVNLLYAPRTKCLKLGLLDPILQNGQSAVPGSVGRFFELNDIEKKSFAEIADHVEEFVAVTA